MQLAYCCCVFFPTLDSGTLHFQCSSQQERPDPFLKDRFITPFKNFTFFIFSPYFSISLAMYYVSIMAWPSRRLFITTAFDEKKNQANSLSLSLQEHHIRNSQYTNTTFISLQLSPSDPYLRHMYQFVYTNGLLTSTLKYDVTHDWQKSCHTLPMAATPAPIPYTATYINELDTLPVMGNQSCSGYL